MNERMNEWMKRVFVLLFIFVYGFLSVLFVAAALLSAE